MTEQQISDIINEIAVTHHPEIPTPTKKELSNMRICGNCEHNKLVKTKYGDVVKSSKFCMENFHYVSDNSIQLTCWLNKQHINRRTWFNKIRIKLNLI